MEKLQEKEKIISKLREFFEETASSYGLEMEGFCIFGIPWQLDLAKKNLRKIDPTDPNYEIN